MSVKRLSDPLRVSCDLQYFVLSCNHLGVVFKGPLVLPCALHKPQIKLTLQLAAVAMLHGQCFMPTLWCRGSYLTCFCFQLCSKAVSSILGIKLTGR
eukprot:c30369_g1_i1 orf=31-321(+)